MNFVIKGNGNTFGSHRVISPEGVLPQPAEKVDNNFKPVWDNEILVNVEFLNIIRNSKKIRTFFETQYQ